MATMYTIIFRSGTEIAVPDYAAFSATAVPEVMEICTLKGEVVWTPSAPKVGGITRAYPVCDEVDI